MNNCRTKRRGKLLDGLRLLPNCDEPVLSRENRHLLAVMRRQLINKTIIRDAVVGKRLWQIQVLHVAERNDAQAGQEKRFFPVGVYDDVGENEEQQLRLEQFPLE